MLNPYPRLHPYRIGWIESIQRVDSVRYAQLAKELKTPPDNWKDLGWTEHLVTAGNAGTPEVIAVRYGHVVETIWMCCGITEPRSQKPDLGISIYIPSTTWLRQRIKYWEEFWAVKDAG